MKRNGTLLVSYALSELLQLHPWYYSIFFAMVLNYNNGIIAMINNGSADTVEIILSATMQDT